MSKPFEVKLHGYKELEQKLKKLGRKGKSIVTSASRAGSKEFLAAAQANLPSKHRNKLAGPLIKKRQGPYTTIHQVGTSKEHWQLVFLEWGVPRHPITPKSKALFGKGYSHPYKKEVIHPGVPELRWLRRAFYGGNVSKALRSYKRTIYKRLLKEAKT